MAKTRKRAKTPPPPAPEPRAKTSDPDVNISAIIPRSLKEAAERVIAAEDRSFSSFVRRAMRHELERLGAIPPGTNGD